MSSRLKKHRALGLLLLTLFTGLQTRVEAKTKSKTTTVKVTKKKSVTTKRACGARSLPGQPGDKSAQSFDVDRDGALDLVVVNLSLKTIRVAFADGPEVVMPGPLEIGGRPGVSFLRFSPDRNVFGAHWLIASSGFYLEGTTLFRRIGCEFNIVNFPFAPQSLSTGTSKTGYFRGPFDEIRCAGSELTRTIYTTSWTPGVTPEFTSKVSTSKYSYSNGELTPIGPPIIDQIVNEAFHPVGSECLGEPVDLPESSEFIYR
jgi:hypothetical protein